MAALWSSSDGWGGPVDERGVASRTAIAPFGPSKRIEEAAPLKLHANLLFYGLDSGTWSGPSPSLLGRGDHGCGAAEGGWPTGGQVPCAPGTPGQRHSLGLHQQELGDTPPGLEVIKAVWTRSSAGEASNIEGIRGFGIFASRIGTAAVNTVAIGGGRSALFATEPSTDEGSEPKGSESDSLPDSNEGYLASGALTRRTCSYASTWTL
mmetsp:Transcript_11575/g.30961  ORF Transcript_11575/g.30961 Transcript_11575/m.30961 type:complete len:208 (-) Transcript_11575:170-793(-)